MGEFVSKQVVFNAKSASKAYQRTANQALTELPGVNT